MEIFGKNIKEQAFVIAEIGNNHEGSFDLARELIHLAAIAGVDAVKLQTCNPELFVSWENIDRLERLRRFQLKPDQYRALAKEAKTLGVIFFSTPLDVESAQFLDGIQPLFKISSGDNQFTGLLETVSSFGKPTIISTGMSSLSDLDGVLEIWSKCGNVEDVAFLHCVSSYPVPPDEANLGAISILIRRYPDRIIGYSDHTIGTQACFVAVALGARIIEKHFSIAKNYSEFRDHQLSADPDELKDLVKGIREVEQLLGSGKKVVQPSEQLSQLEIRRSAGAMRNMRPGEIVTTEAIVWLRPGTGIPLDDQHRIIGRRLTRSVRFGQLFRDEDFQ